jgi:hypothetical protein
MQTKTLSIKGSKVRFRRVYRGFVRATDWLEGSAGGSVASENPTNFIGFRIGYNGQIPGIIVYRPISKPTRKPRPKGKAVKRGVKRGVKELKAWARLDINGEMSLGSLFYYKLEKEMIPVRITPLRRERESAQTKPQRPAIGPPDRRYA